MIVLKLMMAHEITILSELATTGVVAFDSSLGKEVLVMSVVLCFQEDSPMHAEITSTPVPGVALNACRMCALTADGAHSRRSKEYIGSFVGRTPDGVKVSGSL